MGDRTVERRTAAVVPLEPRQLGLGEIFYRTSDAIVVAEAGSGRIVLWNDAAADLFGHDQDAAIGLLVEDLVPAALKLRHRAGTAAFARHGSGELIGSAAKLELPAVHRDGTELWVEMSLTPFERTDLPGRYAMAIVRNITERRRLEGELAERTRQLLRLNELGRRLHGCSTIDEAADVVAAATVELFPSLSGALYVRSTPEDDALERRARWGDTAIDDHRLDVASCRAMDSGAPERGCDHVPAAASSVCLPLTSGEGTLGVLHLRADAADDVSDAVIDAAVALANQVGVAFGAIRLRESLREQTIRDPLTNLFNRRYLDEIIEREVRRAGRHDLDLSVLAIDIDHFKAFNDLHGHDAGDDLLRAIGTYLQSHVRAEDVVCRTGGEEFIVVLPVTALADATSRAEDLRAGIAELRDRRDRSVTISVGIASFPVHAAADELLRAADVALYRAKAAGRDRVEVAGR